MATEDPISVIRQGIQPRGAGSALPLDYKTLFEQSRRKIRDKLAKDGVRLKNPEENEEKGNKEEKLAEEINLPESDFTDRLKERAQRREDYLRNGTG